MAVASPQSENSHGHAVMQSLKYVWLEADVYHQAKLGDYHKSRELFLQLIADFVIKDLLVGQVRSLVGVKCWGAKALLVRKLGGPSGVGQAWGLEVRRKEGQGMTIHCIGSF